MAGIINTPAPGTVAQGEASILGGISGVAGTTTSAALQGPASTYDGAQATAANWDVKPNQTVQSQIQGIIADNSPLMQQAETRALQKANSRGLLNSSMAVGAGQGAVLDAATPIATSDAATFARAGEFNAGNQQQVNLANQNSTNTANQFDAGAKNQVASQNSQLATNVNLHNAASVDAANQFTAQAANTVNLANQQAATNTSLTNAAEANRLAQIQAQQQGDLARIAASGQVQQQLAAFSASAAKELASIEAQYKGLTQASSSAASVMNTTIAAISRIMEDPNLDAAGKQKAIDTYNTNARISLQIIGSLAGDVQLGNFMNAVLA